ncbi:MAG: hypothetical protein RLY16_2041 [Bacteroidota bacterium]|jgi:peptidoglycan/xylan/chitin deacetylase (PgdA/CDA1 family)
MELVRTIKDFTYGESFALRQRTLLRNFAIRLLSMRHAISDTNNWIRFPYYHHVFDDERRGFEKQLRYLKNYGEFISIDQVFELLHNKQPINGRYFCLSFDDGYACLYHNMMPITARLNIPVIIYLPTDYINLDMNIKADFELVRDNLPNNPKLLSFLSWAQCNEMLGQQVLFGAHTKTHANLMNADADKIEFELRTSKLEIEKNLPIPCDHFAYPWGRVYENFDPQVTNVIAAKLGYKTMVTTNRGKTIQGDHPYLIKRDHMLANWGNYQLRYFLSK